MNHRYDNAENAYQRAALNLPKKQSGVIIKSIPKVSNLYGVLQPRDVLVAVDGVRR